MHRETRKRRLQVSTNQPGQSTPEAQRRRLSSTSLVDDRPDDNGVGVSSTQAIHMQNFGSDNRLHVGDDNRDNKGIIVTGGNVQIYPRSASFILLFPRPINVEFEPEPPTSRSIKLSPTTTATIYIKAAQEFLVALFGSAVSDPEVKPGEDSFSSLIEFIKLIVEMEVDDPSAPQAVRDYLGHIWRELRQVHEQLYNADNNSVDVELSSLQIAWALRLFLFVSHMGGYMQRIILVERVKKRMVEMQRDAEAAAPRRLIKDLPRAMVAYDDYISSQRRVSCFEGTRQALLVEVGGWVANSETGIFVLFGLAGIGKSTIAQTVAERADDVRLLGASFFFSRDEAERRTAERFFTTIAFQLCVCDPEFASAIEGVLMTEQGKNAVSKHPWEQLETLILDPLRKLTPRKILIVVDALDECYDEDIPVVLLGLNKLVQGLPSFKVFLTTRPQQHLHLQAGQASQKVFHLHNIEDKIVDGDIELYLRHKLSLDEVKLHLPNLRKPWAASDDEIKSLVRAAGRLFIIASTAVLFILDKTSTPASRMKMLRTALDQDHTPFKRLNNFYTTILRNAVPKGCERDTVDRYQTVIGSIILIQAPLSISALATLVDIDVDDIITVLGNLQPVILLGGNDIPVVYHKSFPDYIQDPARCEEEDLLIYPRFHHTRMAMHCLRFLNRHLKQNILNLSDWAQFEDNGSLFGLEDHLREKIPSESRYACLYFAKHVENADIEEAELAPELEQFVHERLLNWLEALSWIKKLDSAHRALLLVQKQLKPTASDLLPLVADGLRFLGKFYDLIRESALHIYHSALPLTPTETSLYVKYSKQMTFCRVQGGQKKWDGLVATISLGLVVSHVAFSPNSTLLACSFRDPRGVMLDIHDAVTGVLLGRIEGQEFAIANDFSRAAAMENDDSITLYNVNGVTPVATIKLEARDLALSPDGSRLVAVLYDTVVLWDTEKCEQINSFGGKGAVWWGGKGISFSLDGSRLAIALRDGVVKLLDGMSGKIVSDLAFPRIEGPKLVFSRDGSRLACLENGISRKPFLNLKVWNGRDGTLIGTLLDSVDIMEITPNGSLIATAIGRSLKLWSGNDLTLVKTLELDFPIWRLIIHNDSLGVVFIEGGFPSLYNINSLALIARIPAPALHTLDLSADNTRIVTGNKHGEVQLWDFPSIVASGNTLQEQSSPPKTLAFSPDCSRLASGHDDGTVKLWDTSNMAEVAAHAGHSGSVDVLAFGVDGGLFASGSSLTSDGINLWNGHDGALSGVLECSGHLNVVTLSRTTLAAATEGSVTLWDLKTRSCIATLAGQNFSLLAFSHHHSLLAAATKNPGQSILTIWDIEKPTLVFTIDFNRSSSSAGMYFLPDDSQVVLCDFPKFRLFNYRDGSKSEVQDHQTISQLGVCQSWHGIPVWVGHHGVLGCFTQKENVLSDLGDVIVNVFIYLGIRAKAEARGSSMIAFGCKDGRILLVTTL